MHLLDGQQYPKGLFLQRLAVPPGTPHPHPFAPVLFGIAALPRIGYTLEACTASWFS